MDFELTDEQRLIRQTARDFAEREIFPVAAEHDEQAKWPAEVLRKAWEIGLMNITVPQQYGGAGLSYLDLVLVTEQIAWGCIGICTPISLNALAVEVILQGEEALRTRYLGRLLEGELCGYAVTEPGAGSDVAAIQTRADRKGDRFVLNGSKIWISNALHSGFFVLLAKTDPKAGHGGMSFFLVERDAHGVEVGKPIPKLGQRACHASEVFLNDVEVPEEALIGEEGGGFKIAMKAFDGSRPMIAAFGVGLTQRCLDLALQYACERKTFGVPIVQHQAIAHKLAEMQIRLEAARLLTYKSAWLADRGMRNTLEASCAKAFACDTAMQAATEAMQVYGGYGYSKEFPMEKLFRDAKVLQVYEGTSEIQRNIIARILSSR